MKLINFLTIASLVACGSNEPEGAAGSEANLMAASSTVVIKLPDPDSYPVSARSELTGFMILEVAGNTGNTTGRIIPHALDTDEYRFTAYHSQSYSIGLQIGRLLPDGSNLETVLLSSFDPAGGKMQQIAPEILAAQSEIIFTLPLQPTPEGTARGIE